MCSPDSQTERRRSANRKPWGPVKRTTFRAFRVWEWFCMGVAVCVVAASAVEAAFLLIK